MITGSQYIKSVSHFETTELFPDDSELIYYLFNYNNKVGKNKHKQETHTG